MGRHTWKCKEILNSLNHRTKLHDTPYPCELNNRAVPYPQNNKNSRNTNLKYTTKIEKPSTRFKRTHPHNGHNTKTSLFNNHSTTSTPPPSKYKQHPQWIDEIAALGRKTKGEAHNVTSKQTSINCLLKKILKYNNSTTHNHTLRKTNTNTPLSYPTTSS